MNEHDNMAKTCPEKEGRWARFVSDFREVWTTVVPGFLAGCGIAGASGVMAHAAFSGGHLTYGIAYVLTGIFILLSLPAALFFVQTRKG